MAPKINKATPCKLLAIFAFEILLATSIFIAISLGTFSLQEWKLQNGYKLSWEVTLHRIFSRCNCTAKAEFHNICLSTFKRTDGPIPAVKDLICNLATDALPAPPQYHSGIRMIAESCDQMQSLDSWSIATFVLLLLSGAFVVISFFLLLKWCYVSFAMQRRIWYMAAVGSLVLDCVFLTFGLMAYGIGLGSIKSTFDYNRPPGFSSPIGSGSHGWGFWLLVAVDLLHILLFLAFFKWVPRGLRLAGAADYAHYKQIKKAKVPPKTKGVKAKKVKATKKPVPLFDEEAAEHLIQSPASPASVDSPGSDEGDKKIFWAYMPDVLQPLFGGGEEYLADSQYLEEQMMQQQQQVVTTGYGTVTTTYVEQPIIATQYMAEAPMTVHHHYPDLAGAQQPGMPTAAVQMPQGGQYYYQ